MSKLQHGLQQVISWARSHRAVMVGCLGFFLIFAAALPLRAEAGEAVDLTIWENIALGLATIMNWISIGVTKFIVLLIKLVIIPILQYNDYATAPVVTQGWVVVRDLVNMFFVVVLLLIAFQTIFGVGRADWKKQVPRLLIMAIVINFSRTIAGLIIDFAQVVMITFVNAIKDVAGGNFLQLLGLDNLYSFSEQAAANGAAFEVFDLFAASFLTLVLVFLIAGTMIILAALLSFRIVIIWVLVIMSPIAFFLGGAKGVIGPAEGYYADWWKRFTGAVTLGPILTFFLWLSLAAASGGNLAEKQGFEFSNAGSEVEAINQDFGATITKIFEAPHMTSLIISISLLFAGFEISQQTASSMGGRAGQMASKGISGIPGLSRQLARATVGAPLIGARAGGAVGRAGFGLLPVETQQKFRSTVGGGLRDFGGGLAKVPVIGALGRATQNVGIGMVKGVNVEQETARTEATKANAGIGTDGLKALASTPITPTTLNTDKLRIQDANLQLLMSKTKLQKLGDDDIKKFGTTYHQIKGELDDTTLDKFGKSAFLMAPQIAGNEVDADLEDSTKRAQYLGTDGKVNDQAVEDAKVKKIRDQLSVMAQSPSDLLKMESQALKNPLVLKAMEGVQVGRTGLDVRQWVEERGKQTQKDALQEGRQADLRKTGDAFTSMHAAGPAPSDEMSGRSVRTLQPEHVGPGSQNVVTPAMMTPQFAETFAKNAQPETLKSVGQNPQLFEAFNDALGRRAGEVLASTGTAEEKAGQLAQIESSRMRAGMAPGGYNPETKQFEGANDEEKAVRQQATEKALRDNPDVIVNLGDALKAENFGGELATAVSNAFSRGDGGQSSVREIGSKVDQAMSSANPAAEIEKLRKTLGEFEKSLRGVLAKEPPGSAEFTKATQSLKRLNDTKKRFNLS